MIIFLVYKIVKHEANYVIGIYSSYEKAAESIKYDDLLCGDNEYFEIKQAELDKSFDEFG